MIVCSSHETLTAPVDTTQSLYDVRSLVAELESHVDKMSASVEVLKQGSGKPAPNLKYQQRWESSSYSRPLPRPVVATHSVGTFGGYTRPAVVVPPASAAKVADLATVRLHTCIHSRCVCALIRVLARVCVCCSRTTLATLLS